MKLISKINLLRILSVSLFHAVWPISVACSNQEIRLPQTDASLQAFQRAAPRLLNLLRTKDLTLGSPIFIRIFKKSNELEMWIKSEERGFVLLKTYGICHHSGSLGPKTTEGDRQSPEGFYRVGVEQMNPWSKYHLAFNLGYPNEYDRVNGRTGDALMIHGRCSSVGCFAMTDYYMEEIYTLAEAALAQGQPAFEVHIFPFRFDNGNLQHYRQSTWLSFWRNLKEGYDIFERTGVLPTIHVEGKRYVFDGHAAPEVSVSTKSVYNTRELDDAGVKDTSLELKSGS